MRKARAETPTKKRTESKQAPMSGRRGPSPMSRRAGSPAKGARTPAPAEAPPTEVKEEKAVSSPPAPAVEASRVTVAVRIKPTDGAKTIMRFGPRSENALRFCHLEGGKTDDAKSFAYDHVFDQGEGQADLYDAIGGNVLQQVVSGHNASVFAYGQTGSGKTYTMLGTQAERGLIPRLCEGLFKEEQLKGWNITMSFFEIYNEQVVDLLGDKPEEPAAAEEDKWTGVGLAPTRVMPVLNALRVREHAKLGVYVEGLAKTPVSSLADVERALEQGMAQRAVAETAMNAESSRSHAVVQLSLAEQSSGDRTAVLNLIDLAGSENVGRSKSYEDHSRLAEARNINKSLLGLGKCISMLAQGTSSVVPYRDSVLTWLLKDALGGNAHTLMLCAVDPSAENAEQTLTTLRYADQAKNIVTRPVENVDHTKKMVRELHEQVEELRAAAEAAAAAQAAAKAQQAEAEAAAAAAAAAAEQAAAERERAVAEAAAARASEEMTKAEREQWQQEAQERERVLRAREEELKKEASVAAEQLKAAKANAKPPKSPSRRELKKEAAAAAAATAAAGGGGDAGSAGVPGAAISGLPAMMDVPDVASVAAMSREDKLAFMKKLKEERKALYVELGIEEETKQQKAEAAKAEAAAKAAAEMEQAEKAAAKRAAAAATLPQLPGFNATFKCLGFLFTMNVVEDPDSSRSNEAEANEEEVVAKGVPKDVPQLSNRPAAVAAS